MLPSTPLKRFESMNLNTTTVSVFCTKSLTEKFKPAKRSRTSGDANDITERISRKGLTKFVAEESSKEKLSKIIKKVNKIRRKEMQRETQRKREKEQNSRTAASQPIHHSFGQYSGPPKHHSDGLKEYLETFTSGHYSVYALFCPIGTLEEQYASIFYFGITKNILDRLWQHKKEAKNDSPEKWEFFNGAKRYPAVAIMEIYADDYAKSLLMETLFIKHAANLGLKIVNRKDNNTLNQPDPENAKYHHELIYYAFEKGMKYGCVRNVSAKRSVEFKVNRNNGIMIRRIEDQDFVKKSSAATQKWKQNLPEEVDERRKRDNEATGKKRQVHAVKRPVHAYNFWVKDALPRIRKENPGKTNAEYQRMSSDAWETAKKNEEELKPYKEMSAADQKRYQAEMKVWQEKHQK